MTCGSLTWRSQDREPLFAVQPEAIETGAF
jgi:hypothetical protein